MSRPHLLKPLRQGEQEFRRENIFESTYVCKPVGLKVNYFQ
jgi:hypothetical protein